MKIISSFVCWNIFFKGEYHSLHTFFNSFFVGNLLGNTRPLAEPGREIIWAGEITILYFYTNIFYFVF
jgi:hypothetical protein